MKNRKLIISLLLFAMLLPNLAACSETTATEDEPEETTTEATEVQATADAEEEAAEEEAEIQPNLPDADYGGRDFVFITSDASDTNGADWVTYDVYVEELNGEVINDAVYTRNLYLEETYNVKVKDYPCVSLKITQTAVKAGDDSYDAVFTNLSAAAQLAQSGYTYNLYDIPYIDLTQPWWDQRAVEDLELFGKLNYATGDITIIDNDATWTLMFNKQMIEDNGMTAPYDYVNEGTWTFDVFDQMIAQGTKDTNGDGAMQPTVDVYGMATTKNTCQGLMYASGVKLAYKDENGSPFADLDNELTANVVAKAGEILADTNEVFIADRTGYSTSDLTLLFEGEGSLFYGEVMQCVTRMRESETDFGIVPWPKYTEEQDSYYNFVHSTAAKCICIPVTQKDTEMAGIVIEAMAAKSKYTLTKAYYDVALTYKYTRDEESEAMLDIIFDTRVYDIGYVYDWGSLFTSVQNCVYNGGTNYSSTVAKLSKVVQRAIDKTIKTYNESYQ